MGWSHKLVLGMTGFGKSTLNRQLIAQAWNQQPRVASLVLDPNLEGGWGEGAQFVTDNADEYLDIARRSESCLLLVEEAGETLQRDRSYGWIVTRSRHFGHVAVLSTHFATDILPVMRNQCTEAFVFRQNFDAGKVLARQYADDLFLRAPQLGVGQYIHKSGADIARIEKLDLGHMKARK